MTSDAKLLPCPFCGGSADISHDHTVEENHAYGCRACGFWFDTFNSDDPIAAWNTRTPHPAPVTAREAEPTEDELDEAWKEGFNAGFGEAMLTNTPPQSSETVAEAAKHALDACRIIDAAVLEGHDNTSDLICHLLEAVEPARAALRALSSGEASHE